MTLLKVRDAARRLGVSETTLRRQIRTGLIRARRDRFTNRVFVPVEEVERRTSEMEDWTPGQSPQTKDDSDMPTNIKVKNATEEDATPAHPRSSQAEPAPEPVPAPGPEPAPAPDLGPDLEPPPLPPAPTEEDSKEVKRRDLWDDLGDW